MKCPTCNGSGLDRQHVWPDGSFASCETCEGYGDLPEAIQARTLREQRAHKALLWRNIRAAQRNCLEHAQTLRQVFAPLLALKLPRVPKHQ